MSTPLWSTTLQRQALLQGWFIAFNTTKKVYQIADSKWRNKNADHAKWEFEVRKRADNGDALAMQALRAIMAFNLGAAHPNGICVRQISGNDYAERLEIARLKRKELEAHRRKWGKR